MSNDGFRRIVESSPDLVAVIDRAGRFRFANRAHRDVLGREPESLIGTPVMELVHPDDRALAAMGLRDAYERTGLDGAVSVRLKAADGGWVTVETDGAFLDQQDAEGDPAIVLFTRWVDGFSPRGGSEVERLAELLRAQYEASPDGVLVTSLGGDPISFNRRYLDLWGLTEAEVRGGYEARKAQVWSRLVRPEQFSGIAEHLYANPHDSATLTVELTDGRHVEVATAPILAPKGEPYGRAWYYRDVTERVTAERELQASEERYRRMVELSPNAIGVHQNGVLRYLNLAGARLLDLPVEALLGRNVMQMIHPEDLPRVVDNAVEAYFHEPRFVEARLKRPDGVELVVEIASSGTLFDGSPATQTVLRDITARRQAELALLESEDRYRNLVEGAPDAIYVHDGTAISYANRAAARLFGFAEPEHVLGLDPYEVVRGIDRATFSERVGQVLAGKTMRLSERRFLTYAGRDADLEIALAPATVGGRPVVQAMLRDVSQRRLDEEDRLRLERKLLETQKLESLGVLAGGVAHEFSNLLVAMLGNAGLALMEAHADSPLRPYLLEIEAAAQRAGGLARQMLAYSGKGRFVVRPVDLNATVREMENLLRISAGEEAQLTLDLAPGLPLTEGDPGQLHQVVLNLVLNAGEALPGGKGSISVRTGTVVLSKEDLEGLRGAAVESGEYVSLAVRDTGSGMDHATIARIFDPFFSTRFTGRGLGLAAVLGAVRAHQGAIRVQSRPGAGSTFEVLLPVAPPEAGQDR